MCGFTKLAVAWPIRDKKATAIAKGLMERVILPFGAPWMLLTDNVKEFENELCLELCQLMGIEKQRTSFYTPQCNGGVERWHSIMNNLLAKTVEAHQGDWPQRQKSRKFRLKCLFRPPKSCFWGVLTPNIIFFIIEAHKRPYLTRKHAFWAINGRDRSSGVTCRDCVSKNT